MVCEENLQNLGLNDINNRTTPGQRRISYRRMHGLPLIQGGLVQDGTTFAGGVGNDLLRLN